MSKISDETIEKAVVSKKDSGVKSSSKTINKKRKIKDITKKSSKKIIPEVENISNTLSENEITTVTPIIKENKVKKEVSKTKKKRTLCLKIDHKEENKENNLDDTTNNVLLNNIDVPHIVDTSVNQNSPFFYEPSVFEKFNINITSVDEDNSSEIEESQEESKEVEVQEETITNEFVELPQKEVSEDEFINENIEKQEENTNTDVAQKEDIVMDNISSDIQEENDGITEIENIISAENDNLNDEEISKESSFKNVAESVVGKFFDSSIPNINSSSNISPFSKIKKSIFSNISPIFKKFTFEEANIINSERELEKLEQNDNSIENETILNINNNTESSIDITSNLDNISQNELENDFEISAKSVSTSIPDVKTSKENISTNNKNNEDYDINDVNYENIITPKNEDYKNTISDADIENELIEELLDNADFIDDDIEIDEKSTISNEAKEIQEKIEKNFNNIEENIENINLDTNNNDDEYNDDSFSIEDYFGLNNLTDEDNQEIKEEIEKNKIKPKSELEETQENNEEEIISTEDFEKKFLEDNQKDIPYANYNNVPEEENLQENENTNIENVISETNETTAINVPDNNKEEISKETNEMKTSELPDVNEFSKLIENFNKTISSLSERISTLEAEKSKLIEDLNNSNNTQNHTTSEDAESKQVEENEFEQEINEDTIKNDNSKSVEDILSDAFNSNEIDDNLKNELLSEVLSSEMDEELLNDSNNNANNLESVNSSENEIDEDIVDDVDDIDESLLQDFLLENIYKEDLEKISNLEISPVSEDSSNNTDSNEKTEETITSAENSDKNETYDETSEFQNINTETEPMSDFLTIIDSLSKTISELEDSPDIKNSKNELPEELSDGNGKAINILINKDDIFSISILNESYEIVADFDGISVLSENIHISTPKKNFFVKVGEKYIEIHNYKDYFIVNTNFEDVQFANAINNVSFAKKNNKIELNIKEAFKLVSVNNTLELSMLNTTIADMSKSDDSQEINENSICDNRTLLISEETQKVYLPYTIEDVMKKLNSSNEYQTPKEVIENEYTVPLSTFKMPIISRFKEAYRFMRIKEKSSVYAALDLALELMFNSDLNPAIIRAAKDLKELNIYLDCLYENEIDKFDCFKIVYKVLPKIK